jgi:hypothetical protein
MEVGYVTFVHLFNAAWHRNWCRMMFDFREKSKFFKEIKRVKGA